MARLIPPVNDNDHIRGPKNAPIELVEYGDYQCPHCGAAHPVVISIEEAFSKNLRFIFRHFPLSEVHPFAQPAAMAAEAAGMQGNFWEMHDMIFENQSHLSERALIIFAETLKLNMHKFAIDFRSGQIVDKVESDFESGIRSGVNGTPSFFINGIKYNGIYDFRSMAEAIERSASARQHI